MSSKNLLTKVLSCGILFAGIVGMNDAFATVPQLPPSLIKSIRQSTGTSGIPNQNNSTNRQLNNIKQNTIVSNRQWGGSIKNTGNNSNNVHSVVNMSNMLTGTIKKIQESGISLLNFLKQNGSQKEKIAKQMENISQYNKQIFDKMTKFKTGILDALSSLSADQIKNILVDTGILGKDSEEAPDTHFQQFNLPNVIFNAASVFLMRGADSLNLSNDALIVRDAFFTNIEILNHAYVIINKLGIDYDTILNANPSIVQKGDVLQKAFQYIANLLFKVYIDPSQEQLFPVFQANSRTKISNAFHLLQDISKSISQNNDQLTNKNIRGVNNDENEENNEMNVRNDDPENNEENEGDLNDNNELDENNEEGNDDMG